MSHPNPHANAPKCWTCCEEAGSCNCADCTNLGVRHELLQQLDVGIGALVQIAYDFDVSRKGDQLYLEGKTTSDQEQRHTLADIFTFKQISGLSVDDMHLTLQVACLLLNDAATIGPLLFKHYREHGVDV